MKSSSCLDLFYVVTILLKPLSINSQNNLLQQVNAAFPFKEICSSGAKFYLLNMKKIQKQDLD